MRLSNMSQPLLFVSVSGVAFFYLFMAIYQVLTSGPLNESGMIFAFLPFV